MDPATVAIAQSAWAQFGAVAVLVVAGGYATKVLWARLTVVQDREAGRLDAAIKADVEASGALREVAGAVTTLKGAVDGLRDDLRRTRP